jgi:hypothetical protein
VCWGGAGARGPCADRQAVPISLYVSFETVKVAQCKMGALLSVLGECVGGGGGVVCIWRHTGCAHQPVCQPGDCLGGAVQGAGTDEGSWCVCVGGGVCMCRHSLYISLETVKVVQCKVGAAEQAVGEGV